MTTQAEVLEGTQQYLIPNYGRLPVAMARGAGSRIWDVDGKEYIDFFAGFGGAGALGHCHGEVVSAIQAQAERLLCHGNLFTNAQQVELARLITQHGFGGKVFFCHSGAEADEAALKLVRLAAGEGRYKIISFENCFHGRTMGGLSLTPRKFQAGFEPMLPGNVMVPMGDLQAVADAIDGETAGVFIEPIQGEGGVNVPSREYMHGLRELCDKHKLLLVVDEVWTAPARTGRWFAYQLHGITPDVMTLGKAIGGGTPLAACVAAAKYQDVLQPGTHGCTMGGNPLCTAAGAATMRVIAEQDLVARADEQGESVMQSIRDAGIGCVKDVRGAGMMIGVELDIPGKDAFMRCMERGLLINVTQDRIIRLAPPLNIDDTDLSEGIETLMEVLSG